MRCFDRLIRDEKGSATIEFVLWVPVIMAVLVIVLDATALYITHKEMWNVARDTARRIVLNPVAYTSNDCDVAFRHIDDSMGLRNLPYRPKVSYDPTDGAEVSILLRLNDMAILGYSPLVIFGGDVQARVAMRADPNALIVTADCES